MAPADGTESEREVDRSGDPEWRAARAQMRRSYLHTGRRVDVPQVLAGAVDAEILVLPQTWVPLLALSFPPPLPFSSPSLAFDSFSLQDG